MLKFKYALVVAITTATLLPLTSTFAGAKSTQKVSIGTINSTTGLRYAVGSLKDARNSSDTNEYIGCVFSGPAAGSTGGEIDCAAVDATGASVYCQDKLPTIATAAMASGISSASYIYFEFDASNKCTLYVIQNGSNWL